MNQDLLPMHGRRTELEGITKLNLLKNQLKHIFLESKFILLVQYNEPMNLLKLE